MPSLAGNFVPPVQRQLVLAFGLAKQRVHQVDSCASLFTRLGADGVAELGRARYVAGLFDGKANACRAGVAAVTAVGQPRVALCPGFGVLGTTRAALVLIHEALHIAGMTERPSDPAALSADEINQLVKVSCNL